MVIYLTFNVHALSAHQRTLHSVALVVCVCFIYTHALASADVNTNFVYGVDLSAIK